MRKIAILVAAVLALAAFASQATAGNRGGGEKNIVEVLSGNSDNPPEPGTSATEVGSEHDRHFFGGGVVVHRVLLF